MANSKHPGFPDWWDPEVAAQYEKNGYGEASHPTKWRTESEESARARSLSAHAKRRAEIQPLTNKRIVQQKSTTEIERSIAYRNERIKQRVKFSKGVEDSVAEASKFLSFFDIETGGLKPDSPIYEMGFMHLEGGEARFTHHFVNPTEIHTDKPGRIDQWTLDKMKARGEEFGDTVALSDISQKKAAGIAYGQMHGRDVVIQNARFEREALNARTGPAIFNSIARGMKLESFSRGRGLFPTNMAVKDLTAEASRRSRVGNVGSYLDAWEDVFTQGIAPMFAERKEGVTRALDLMDLTKSVFAMAQKRNLMGNAGELFTGVSVGAFSKAMYGIDEAHIANFDNVLQGEMFHHFMGAGYAMAAGEELPDEMKGFFRRMSDMIPEQKQRNTVKNIIDTFKNQQEFLASEAAGAPNWDLLEGARINANRVEATVPVNVLNEAGEYVQTTASFPLRERLHPQTDRGAFTTDIKQLVNFWEEDAKNTHGVKADYKAALAEAEKQYINPYKEALAKSRASGLKGAEAITSALATVAPKHAEVIQALEAKAWAPVAAAPPPPTGGIKNFIKNNWKIGLAGAGLIFAANLISGSDDEYNYIEGMRHAGIAGGSRKQNTDFGSGWNALRGLVRAGETFAEMLGKSDFAEAIANSSHARDLGQGMFGKTAVRRASYRGQEFEFVRKTIKPGREAEVDLLREAAYSHAVSDSVSPNVYAASPTHIDFELFRGKTLRELYSDDLANVPESLVTDAISKVHEQNIFHNDLNPGNMMYIPEEGGPGKIGIIDFGHFGTSKNSGSDSVFTKLEAKIIPNKGQEVTATQIDWAGARAEDLKRGTQSFRQAKRRKNPIYKQLKDEMQPSLVRNDTIDPIQIFDTLHLGSKVQGRPASNVNHNTIEGFPGAPIAAQRRGQNTGGQFHSPWQGMLYRGTTESVFEHEAQGRGYVKEELASAEAWLEQFREKHYPHRPSRFTSTFWTPNPEVAEWFATGRGRKEGYISSMPAPEGTFFTSGDAFSDFVTAHGIHNDLATSPHLGASASDIQEISDYREAMARRYWDGSTPSTVRGISDGYSEALIPGKVSNFEQVPTWLHKEQQQKAKEAAQQPRLSPERRVAAEPRLAAKQAAGDEHTKLMEEFRQADAAPPPPQPKLEVRQPTSETHPGRQTSNVVSAVAEEVAEKTVNPATQVAAVTEAVNPVAKAKGVVSGGKGLIAAGILGLGGLFWAMSGASKRDGGNQFGSPWIGLRNLVADAVGEGAEQYALFNARQRNKERKEEREEGYAEGLNPHFEGSLATIDINDFAVEDADTIRMFMTNGESASIRLAGIDAPEVRHENDDGSRIWPDQPYGQEAKSRLQEILAQQSNLRAVIDPTATETYGRPVGMLIGDQGQNINLQLVREGAAASLPFGKRSTQITNQTEFNRAEEDAAAAQQGMWSADAWQIARQAQMNNKRKTTNVTYTDLGRLFSNFKASSILTRMRNPDAEFSDMEASGDRTDFNIIEGMQHGWVGANRRTNLGDFGSPYIIKNTIPRVPASYASKKRVIEGQYLANTQLRRSMKRENVVRHYRG
jgi:endonuclease YncB( thermonuclease family)